MYATLSHWIRFFALAACCIASVPSCVASQPCTEEKAESDSDNYDIAEQNQKDKAGEKDKEEDKEKEEPPKIGNFTLPPSQQPGPLVSFGDNIIDGGVATLYLFADRIELHKGYKTDLAPGILYGITDSFSVFVNFPVSPGNQQDGDHSSGLEDWNIQLEYAFYNQSTKCYTNQATIVGELTFPTGSSHKIPPTGFGSPSFFFGTTYNHTGINWFYFGSAGATFTTSYHGTRFGNQYFYECGFGRNIWTPPGWIYAWMVEFTGQYSEKNLIDGSIDPDSGGNIVYATPSLWISNEKLIIQIGIGFPIVQHMFGKQPDQYYTIDINVGWTF